MTKSAREKSGDTTTTAADRGPEPMIESTANITEDEIARRACDLYLARGCEPGHNIDDWLQAEHELRARSLASVA
jgi:Protein of unknown function (DUF2934)